MVENKFEITFWGVRGSSSVSNKASIQHGCNTPCVSVEVNDTFFVFDAGTGLVNFSNSYLSTRGKTEINLFLSHFHIDHILGLPFLNLVYNKDAVINIYSKAVKGEKPQSILNRLFTPPFFPIRFFGADAVAKIHFFEMEENQICQFSNGVTVEHTLVNHPGDATAFKLTYDNKSFCYMTDIELQGDSEKDAKALELAKNTDILVIDSFFLDGKFVKGWGHSSWRQATDFANMAAAKKTVMFHHNISAGDDILDRYYDRYKNQLKNLVVAKDGLIINL